MASAVCRVVVFLLGTAIPLWSQPQQTAATAQDSLGQQTRRIRRVLARPTEIAFREILTDVQIVRRAGTAPPDTSTRYDIVVCYDPLRYRAPYAGLYPLSFIDQFIAWGRRLALYSRLEPATWGRFYLWDLSTGRQGWIALRDARGLGSGASAGSPIRHTLPAAAGADSSLWLTAIARLGATTDERIMGRWIRLLHEETGALLDEPSKE